MRSHGKKNWYEDWFDDTYLALYDHRDESEARKLVNCLAETLPDLPYIPTVLDMGCGAGRHARVMRTLGWSVWGADLSPVLLQHAYHHKNQSQNQDNLPDIHYIRADIRRLPFAAGSFNLVLSAFTSFGYFIRDEEHLAVFHEVNRTLCDGGWFVLDVMNPVTVLQELVLRDVVRRKGLSAVQTRRFDNQTHRIEKQVHIEYESGETREIMESVRLFTQGEILEMAHAANLSFFRWMGDYNGSEFHPTSSKRMILLARKQA